MKKDPPEVVLAMGSYASVGPLAAARTLRVPIVLHEANVLPGRANALFAHAAACVGVTFEETRHYLRGRRVVHTGMPLRRGLNPGRTEPPAFEGVLRLLVMGGSRGAHALNETLPPALARVQDRGHRVCVTHLAGAEDRDRTAARYGEAGVDHDTRDFCGDMDPVYRMTHLAVCRAGASTCAELSAYGIPALFVPYPHATADHQTLNARQLEKRGAADIAAQDQLTPEWLADYLLSFFDGPERLRRMSAASRGSGIGSDPAALAESVLNGPEGAGPVRVLVLGAGHSPSAERPLSSELSATAIARLAEGVRLHRALPGSRLVTSGGGRPPGMAATGAALAQSWGIEAIDIHPTPANTAQEARVAAERFGDAPLVLVTSASHMPRAMALFRARGLDPIPAPTHYLHPPPEADAWRVRAQRPSATGLRMSERAIYEYLGLAWAALRGTI